MKEVDSDVLRPNASVTAGIDGAVDDTIFALSSGPGRSGVAVIRISGPAVRDTMQRLCGRVPDARRVMLSEIRDPASGSLLDKGLVVWFAAPRSFTGEDCAELHVHGGMAVVGSVLSCLAGQPGLRAATAGEFARRAFMNGKIDLLAAEGLADLIDAETRLQQEQAIYHSTGLSADVVESWRHHLIDILASIEAAIDFSDEEGVADEALRGMRSRVVLLRDELERHLEYGRRGEIIRDGARVVIAGPPNVGKSSLLNCLAGREAAIVTELPGTTRDIVEVRLDLDGLAVFLSDTAGLRDGSGDVVEGIGMDRAREAMRASDLVLWMASPDVEGVGVPVEVDSKALRIMSKADLLGDAGDRQYLSDADHVISTRSGDGIGELLAAIRETLIGGHSPGEPAIVVRQRHRQAVKEAIAHLDAALVGRDRPIEAISEDVRLASRSLGGLTGAVGAEDVLDSIFARFCIGK